MRIVIASLLFLTLVHQSCCMTKAQLKNAGKVMKNVCLPKNNVTNDQVENISKGVFLDDPNVKCYISCVLTMAKMTKNGKLNVEASKKQIDSMYPEDMKESAKKAIDTCKAVSDKYKDGDPCEAAFHISKCVYNEDPENFMFP